MENYEVNGRIFPVERMIHAEGKSIPVLNIRMMSDEREKELARKGATA